MPTWLIGKATPLLDSLKRAADVSDEQLYNDAAYIYRQNLKQYFDQPNGLPDGGNLAHRTWSMESRSR